MSESTGEVEMVAAAEALLRKTAAQVRAHGDGVRAPSELLAAAGDDVVAYSIALRCVQLVLRRDTGEAAAFGTWAQKERPDGEHASRVLRDAVPMLKAIG